MTSDSVNSIDPELFTCLQRTAHMPSSDLDMMTPDEARAAYEATRAPWNEGGPVMAETTRGTLNGGIPFVRHVPGAADDGVTVFLHGGGWVTGSIATHDGIMRQIASQSGRTVIGLDYPRAPEARRGGIVSSCLAAARQIKAEAKGPVIFAGDSAGGELSLSIALELRDAGEELPAGLALLYPALWPRFDTKSHVVSGDGRFGLPTVKMRAFWRSYLGETDAALPARPDLAGLPPCFVLGAVHDCLLDDALDLSRQLARAAISHECWFPAGTVHGFLHYASGARVAMDAHQRLGRFIREI